MRIVLEVIQMLRQSFSKREKINLMTKTVIIGVIASFCFCIKAYAQQETVSLTTIYSSPYATYKNLRLKPRTEALLHPCGDPNEGEFLYRSRSGVDTVMYCAGILGWVEAGGGDGENWTLVGVASPPPDNYLYPNDLSLDEDWNVGIGTDAPATKLHLEGGALLFTGTYTGASGVTPVSGIGNRLMWIPEKGAFRAGRVDDDTCCAGVDFWDDQNIGDYSFAVGRSTKASGLYSAAMGLHAEATGEASFASGDYPEATGNYSVALGRQGVASGLASVAMGDRTVASGEASFATGRFSRATGNYSFASGYYTDAREDSSIAMGHCARVNNTHVRSVAINLQPRYNIAGGCLSYCETTAPGQFKICGDLTVSATPCPCPCPGPPGCGYTWPVCVCGNSYSNARINADIINAYEVVCGSKTFKIPHPDPDKPKGTFLKHSSVEAPTAGDNIYRWTVDVVSGEATIELPDYYKFLNKDDIVCITAKGHFGAAYGEVDEAQEKLSIQADADGKYNVLLIGTRKDKYATSAWDGPEVFVQAD
ncbi:MAG: hypothetical protein ABH954_03640 [Candidatus Omnitrophota bacterium]